MRFLSNLFKRLKRPSEARSPDLKDIGRRASEVIPIEVKSGINVRAFSIREYMRRYGSRFGLLISGRNISSAEIRHVPLSMVGRLDDFGY